MKKIFLLIAICLLSWEIKAQNTINQQNGKLYFNEEFRHKALNLFDRWELEAAFGKKMHINMEESDNFFAYADGQSRKYMFLYFQQVQEGSITKANALQFWIDKLPYFESLYNSKYLAYKAEQKNILNTADLTNSTYKDADGNNNDPQTGGAICNNLDFSTGSTAGWVGAWTNATHTLAGEKYGAIETACSNNLTAGFNSSGTNKLAYVHEMTTPGLDPHVPIQRTPPGHTFALRLGNDYALEGVADEFNNPPNNPPFYNNGGGWNSYNHQTIKNTFAVTSQNNTIVYWYAAVFDQDKGAPHAATAQPYFKIRMYDAACNVITCASYDVNATLAFNGTIPGFLNKDTTFHDATGYWADATQTFIYKDWTQIFIPLINYTGTNVTLMFETSDCSGGGHFGYAYIAADCGPFSVISSSPYSCGNNNITLTAPAGAQTYSWTTSGGGNIVSGATTPTVTVNHGGSYTVTMTTPGNGATCTFAIDTVIPGNSVPPSALFTTANVCGGAPVNISNTSTGGPFTNQVVNWGDGTKDSTAAGTNYSPSHSYATPGTYTILLTVNNPCPSTYTTTVTVSPGPVPVFSTLPVCLGSPTSFTDASTGATTYTWSYGDAGNTTSNTVGSTAFTYTLAGNYTATLTVSSAGCTASITHPVVVNPMPTAALSTSPVCLGTATTISSTVTPAVGTTYNWTFGDGGTSTSSGTQTHTYATAGTFPVSVTVTVVGGCTVTANVNAVVNPIPTAAFSTLPVCLGNPTSFTDASTGAPTTYTWSYGDAANTTSNIVGSTTFTYPLTGNYTATLTVSSAGCSASITHIVVVNPVPTAAISTSNVCLGTASTISSTVTPAAGTTYNWTFGDGGTSTSSGTQTHTYATAGTFPVSVTVTAVGGCSVTANANAVVSPIPTAAFSVPQVCLGTASVFANTSTSDSSCIWNFGGAGNPATAISNCNPSYTYSSAGTFPVTLTVTAMGGCTATVTGSAVVNTMPLINFTVNQPCLGTAVNFTNNTPNQASFSNWSWTFGDGNTSTAISPTNNYAAAGVYTAVLSATTTTGCTGTFSASVTVHPKPVASFSNTTVCLNTGPTAFKDLSTVTNPAGINDNITTWAWTFGDGNTSTLQNPTNPYATCGTFNASLIVTTNNNCTNTFPLTVTVNCVPVLSPLPNILVCPASNVAPGPFVVDIAGSITSWVATTNVTGLPGLTGTGNIASYTSIAQNLSGGIKSDVITATPTSAAGCIGSPQSFTISVYPTPLVNTMPDIALCAQQQVNVLPFSSTPGGSTFGWVNSNTTIGLGANGAGNIAPFTGSSNNLNVPNVGTVSVTPTLNGCVGPDSIFTITIAPQPTVTVANQGPYCPGDPIPAATYTSNPNDPATTYTWTNTNPAIGLGASGSGITPAFTAPINNSLLVMTGAVTVIPTLNGCVGLPASYTITVNPTPFVNHIPNKDFCPSVNTPTLGFTSIPAGPTTYTWINTNSAIGLASSGIGNLPSFLTVNAGTNIVTATIHIVPTLNGCVGPDSSFQIAINPLPNPAFTFSRACLGAPTRFTDESTIGAGTIATWDWDYNNDGVFLDGSGANPQTVLTPAGTHTIGLSVTSNKLCKNQVYETVYVNPLPVVKFGGGLAGCPVLPVIFTESSAAVGQNIVSWNWNFGNGQSSTAQFPTVVMYNNSSLVNPVYYNVTLTVKTDSGCTATLTKNNFVEVYPKPRAGFTWGPQDADILAPTIHFYNTSVGGSGNLPINYYLGDVFINQFDTANWSNLNNPIHTYNDQVPYTYYVTQWVKNVYGCKDSITEPVVIKPVFTFYIPNAFSPNQDGKNEGFKGTGIGIDNTTYNLWVFDRWGNQIFHSNNLEETWNGTVNEVLVQEDVYVWKVRFSDMTGTKHEYHGHVSLIK